VYVFSSAAGTPLDPANLVKRLFEPTLRRAGLRKIRWHDLRHSYASILINEGANLKFVSKQLGHSSISITLDRYSHLMPERHDAIVAHLDKLLSLEDENPVGEPPRMTENIVAPQTPNSFCALAST
jgi:integrase